jgi:hypothetical protein
VCGCGCGCVTYQFLSVDIVWPLSDYNKENENWDRAENKIIIYLILIIIIMRGENFVAHLDGLGGTPVAHHWTNLWIHGM